LYVAFPGSLKFNVHVPAPPKLTIPDEIVHTPEVADVIVTASPDVDVALGT